MHRLRTLGGLSLEGADGTLTGSVAQGRRLALLSIIAATGSTGVSRDRLIGLLWPENEPGKARQVLAQWLHLIRRDLGDDELFLGTAALRLNPERITSDVGDLTTALDQNDLERAATLYAGPFLDGFYLGGAGAPEFERWVEEERARLVRRMRTVYETLVRRCTECGDGAGAVRWAERLAALDPLDSRAALIYMRALAAAGEREHAIRHARVYASLVRNELDAEPDAAVERLAEELRSGSATALVAREAEQQPLAAAAREADAIVAPTSAETPRRRRSLWLRGAQVAALVAIAAVAVSVVTSGSRLRPDAATRVMVAPFENETGDPALEPLGSMAADWIVSGVGETGLLEVTPDVTTPIARVTSARVRAANAGAGTLITGRYYRQGDSLAFQAQIVDVVKDRVLLSAGPVIVERTRPLDAVEALRRRMMGGVAALVDGSFAPLGSLVALPPSYEAFRELSEGNEAARLRRHIAAIAHYRRAIALDSTYLFPHVQIAHAYGNNYDCAHVDSVARALAPKRAQLTNYESLLLRREEQTCAGDLAGAYRSSTQLIALWPASGLTRQYHAKDASAINRPHESLAMLMPSGDTVQPPRLHAYFLASYNLHLVGDHARELKVARDAKARFADFLEPFMFEGRALAALDDMRGVRDVVNAVLISNDMSVPNGQNWTVSDVLTMVIDELRAHGHESDAALVSAQLGEWLDRHPPPAGNADADFEHLMVRFNLALEARQWRLAHAFLDTLRARHDGHIVATIAAGRLAAHEGDSVTAEAISTKLAHMPGEYLQGRNTHGRALIAAVLGQRAHAVQLLRDALAEGRPYNVPGWPRINGIYHANPELQSLRGYPPFEELLRPRD